MLWVFWLIGAIMVLGPSLAIIAIWLAASRVTRDRQWEDAISRAADLRSKTSAEQEAYDRRAATIRALKAGLFEKTK